MMRQQKVKSPPSPKPSSTTDQYSQSLLSIANNIFRPVLCRMESWMGLSDVRRYVMEKPKKCFLLTVLLASLLFPLSVYLTFFVTTFSLTFTIFLLVEGFFIITSSFAVVGILCVLVPVSMTSAVFLLAGKKIFTSTFKFVNLIIMQFLKRIFNYRRESGSYSIPLLSNFIDFSHFYESSTT